MRKILLVLEDKDFKELSKAKEKIGALLKMRITWESFVLHLLRREK